MYNRRTDLAMEAKELWQESAGETTKLHGVRAREQEYRGITTTVVEIRNQDGVRALKKPMGTYVTMQLQRGLLRDPAGFTRAAVRLGREIAKMVPAKGPVLVVGLGNSAVTPDSLGPKALEHLVITRHLGNCFPQFRSVSAIAPGVLGTTGLESVEVVRGVVERSDPVCVVVLDALASCSRERVCTTVQLADTGITPGSGVGNSRAAFDKASLGVPVLAVGVPTVVEAGTFEQEILRNNGIKTNDIGTNENDFMILTPRDVDARVNRIAKLLGYGVSLGLHTGLRVDEIGCFVN